MRRKSIASRLLVALLAGAMVTGGMTSCIGPFKLTKKLKTWNDGVGDKWINELTFVGFNILPVYTFSLLGDAIIFNSFEFWGAKNPIDSTKESGDSGGSGDTGGAPDGGEKSAESSG